MKQAPTRLCLVRHGETDWNAARRLQGSQDIALNARGEDQARRVADALAHQPFAAIYSSQLRRAAATAHHIAQQQTVPVTLEPAFRERHMGLFQGLSRTEAAQLYPEFYQRFHQREPSYAPPGGGESLLALHDRVTQALHQLVQEHPGQQILVVTHGGVLDMVYRLVTGMALDTARGFAIPNVGINWIGCDQDVWSLIQWADTRHLDMALDEI